MPRFVILRHDLPADSLRPSHYDLMLEQGTALRTWACERLPAMDEPLSADLLPDHRLAYLEYEGPLSGNRGSVTRIDAGQYELLVDSPELVRVKLAGQLLRGVLTLTLDSEDAQRWSVVLSPE